MGKKPDEVATIYRDLQENAADYSRTITDLEEVTDRQKQLTKSESLIYLKSAKDEVKTLYSKNKLPGESEEEFVQTLTEAANMTPRELFTKTDPKYKRFQFRIFKTGQEINNATLYRDKIAKTTQKAIEKGQYTPESMPRYSMSGSNKKYGAGLIADRVKQDLQVAGLTGYTDFNTGNRDKFKDMQGNDINIDELDPRTINVEYDSGWGRPSYIITAKNKDGVWQTLRVVPPSTHQQHITKAIEQEFAIGVNDGNLESAAKAARFYEEQNGNLLDLAGQSIKPTNENIAGRKMLARIGGEDISYEKPYTVSYESNYGNGQKLQVVTYTDKGQQKWGVAIHNSDSGVTALIGKAEKRNGIITNKVDHQSISDMTFTSYDKALDNALLYKVSSQVPVDQIYETIPKDLKGMGLGEGFKSYDSGDTSYDDSQNDDN